MAKHDLSSNLESEFTFSIGGLEFNFRKPTVREMRLVATQFSALNEADTDPSRQQELNEQAMRQIYSFVSPVNHSQNIADVLEDQVVDVQIAFSKMVQAELGA